uniref:Putative secreted peptide of 4.3 kDa n=1 Tax=Ixodes ricinus TaxID=34613 RepID=V5H8U8_IXORI
MLKMAQKLTLMMFVVFGLLAISTFDHVVCSGRDKGHAKRPDCTDRPCTETTRPSTNLNPLPVRRNGKVVPNPTPYPGYRVTERYGT